MEEQNNKIEFDIVIDALLNDEAAFPIEYFVEFSDILQPDLVALKKVWNQITPQRKAKLFENLEVIYEADYTKDFSQVAILGLDDINGVIRASSIRLLDDIESRRLIAPLVHLLLNDLEISVRAQAAASLGKFVYLGELEEIPEQDLDHVEDALMQVLVSDEHELVRQKALESIGYSGSEEVKSYIQNAYLSANNSWIKSALVAMGRSADDFWEDKVLEALLNPNQYIQREAIRAAGELEIKSARKLLVKQIIQDTLEEENWAVAIWALSKIGGEGVEDLFQSLLEKAEEEQEILFLEDAIENLQLTNGILPELDLLDINEVDESRLREFSIDDDDLSDELFRDSWIKSMERNLEDEDDFDEDEYYDDDEEIED
ncbi:MAG: hypothetical protein CL609_01530 [Anaerolineaceae bacterium]|nr:hypothetical protein [Anaerolineaceae bacterium]